MSLSGTEPRFLGESLNRLGYLGMRVPVTFVRKVNYIVLGQFIGVKKCGYLQNVALAINPSDFKYVSLHSMCSHCIHT